MCPPRPHQIEGAVGRGRAGPVRVGRLRGGAGADQGRVGRRGWRLDHYHRYREDVALLRELGVGRVPLLGGLAAGPAGRQRAGQRGRAGLLRPAGGRAAARRAIAPVPTLFHWDTPQALEERGGWLDRDTAERFAEYADVVAARLGDRVRALDHAQRAGRAHPARATALGAARARAGSCCSTRCRRPTTSCSATAWPCRRCAPRGATGIGIANSHGPTWPARRRPRRTEAADSLRPAAQPAVRGAGAAGRATRTRAGGAAAGAGRRGPEGHLAAAGLVRRSTTTSRRWWAPRGGRPATVRAATSAASGCRRTPLRATGDRGISADRLRLAGGARGAHRAAGDLPGPVRRPAAAGRHHRERLLVRGDRRPGADRLPGRASAGAARGDGGRASTSAATSSGR